MKSVRLVVVVFYTKISTVLPVPNDNSCSPFLSSSCNTFAIYFPAYTLSSDVDWTDRRYFIAGLSVTICRTAVHLTGCS